MRLNEDYLGCMAHETHLLEAEFNPSIPVLLVWILGWGQWVNRLYYQSLRCALTDRHLQFSKGHFFKTEKTIPLENIQDLTFIDNPLLKLFDLRILKVETAGNSGQTGADMKPVGIVDAASFKKEVMAARDRFQERRVSGRTAPLEGTSDVAGLLREIHASIEGLRSDLIQKGSGLPPPPHGNDVQKDAWKP